MLGPWTIVTVTKKVTISGLTLAGIYQFQIRALGVLGYTDWPCQHSWRRRRCRCWHVSGYGVTLAEIADELSRRLDRPVIDKTGLSGSFDFSLQYAPVNAQQADTPGAPAPDILTAVEEQLGLKLEATKAPIEVFVIDSVQKLSEN